MNVPHDMRERRHLLVFDPQSEIIGQSILNAVDCLNMSSIAPLLQRYDLVEVEPDAWYPMQRWLNVLTDMSTNGSAMFDYISLGVKIAEVFPYPVHFSSMSFANVLKATAQLYAAEHRGGDYGSITAVDVGPREVQFDMRTPYPDDFLYGLTFGAARRFVHSGTHFTVEYNDEVLRRDKGGERTFISVFWA